MALSINFYCLTLVKYGKILTSTAISFSKSKMNKNHEKKQRSSPLSVQTKEIIEKLCEFINKLQSNEISTESLKSDVGNREIIAKICNISSRSVYRVLKERNIASEQVNNESQCEIDDSLQDDIPRKRKMFSAPQKRGPKTKRKTDIDDHTKDMIRHIIYDFHITEKRIVTIEGLKDKVNKELGLNVGATSLRAIIRQLGFRWRKTKDNRPLLMEKEDVVSKRARFLRSIRKYRSEKRKIFFMDETYIHVSHTKKTAWSDNSNNGLRKPVSNKSKLIIVDAGNEDGFVPNARIIFRPEEKKEDYHDHMNFNNYEKWVKEKLLPNLPPRSVVVIDNAPYHNVQVEKVPNTSNRKDVIQNWLREHNIPFEQKLLKAELLEIVKANKHRFLKYRIDQIFEEAGHNVLRLPPYHPTLNPIENIWGIVKGRVATRNVDFEVQTLIQITEEEFNNVTSDEWRKTVEHAWREEEKFIERDALMDDVVTLPDEDFYATDSESDDEIDVQF